MKLLTLRKLHKWAALFVGLQLVLWSLSGLVFAWLDHHEVQGHEVVAAPVMGSLPAGQALTDPGAVLRRLAGSPVTEVKLLQLGRHWVYRVVETGRVRLFRAEDGTPLEVDRSLAADLANRYYAGDGQLVAIERHAGPTLETRKAGPSWEARYADEHGTSVYVSADDGSFIVARTTTWRIFDFFWMLHTMDYEGRDDFNNPLVIFAGSVALWISLTGLLLVIRLYRPKGKPRGQPARA